MPNNEIHETQSPGQQPGAGLISEDFKKMLIIPAITLILNFAYSWYASQAANGKMEYRIETLEKNEAAAQASVKANADALNQLVIQTARSAEAMSRLAQDTRDNQADIRQMNTGRQ